jgi:transposase
MVINDIAKIYQVDRDTVSTWITKWEQEGEASLHDQPRSGRPPKLTPEEQALAIASIKEEPVRSSKLSSASPPKPPSASVSLP